MATHISALDTKSLAFDALQVKVIIGQQKEVQKELDEFMNAPENKYVAVHDIKINMDSSLFICCVISHSRYNRKDYVNRQQGDFQQRSGFNGNREGYHSERSYNGNGNYPSRRYNNL